MKRILLISSKSEAYYYTPFLEAAEKVQGLDIVVFDTSRFPSEAHASIRMAADGCVEGHIDIVRYCPMTSIWEPDTIELSSIEVAWYLRADPPTPTRMNSIVDIAFATGEANYALRAIWSVMPWRWINTKETIRRVDGNKLYQQMVAAKSGLLIPQTLSSNDPEKVASFANIDGQVLIKPYGYTDIDVEKNLFCYANLFDAEEIESAAASIQECPVFAQRYVHKRYEYRVTIAGERILSCRIDSQASQKTRIDWRHYDFDLVAHEAIDLPPNVNAALLRFMKNIDLQYGAIDMIENTNGDFVFLEINPSGQWGWIRDFAKLPIPEAVVHMLLRA